MSGLQPKLAGFMAQNLFQEEFSNMTAGNWLKAATTRLQSASIPSARLDSLILLEDATGLSRSSILAHPELPINTKVLSELNQKLVRRLKYEPLAYIRGHVEFYGQTFKVTPAVLIPRPESESFINLLATLKPKKDQVLIDVGTGSGAIAISAVIKFPLLKIYATDISKKALQIAEQNARLHKTDITFIKANLLNFDITKPADFIIANLPYVPKIYSVSPDTIYEPKSAIFANQEGLGLISKLIPQASRKLKKNGYLLLESLAEQQTKVQNIAKQNGFYLAETDNLVQVFKKK
jgi:release factor glutamine methyltransferase